MIYTDEAGGIKIDIIIHNRRRHVHGLSRCVPRVCVGMCNIIISIFRFRPVVKCRCRWRRRWIILRWAHWSSTTATGPIRGTCRVCTEGGRKVDLCTSVYRKRKHEGIENGSIEITRSLPRGGVLYIMITRNAYCAYADITRAVHTVWLFLFVRFLSPI